MESKENSKKTGKGIFREKSIERVSCPEELNDYIRVTSPSVWIVLIALVVLLVGMLAWSIIGTVQKHSEDGSRRYRREFWNMKQPHEN